MTGTKKPDHEEQYYESETSLPQSYKYKATQVTLTKSNIYKAIIETEDHNYSKNGSLKVNLLLTPEGPDEQEDAPISDNHHFQVLVMYPVAGGGHRFDTVTSGKVSYTFDSQEEIFKVTKISFEAKGDNSLPHYSFSNGKAYAKGMKP